MFYKNMHIFQIFKQPKKFLFYFCFPWTVWSSFILSCGPVSTSHVSGSFLCGCPRVSQTPTYLLARASRDQWSYRNLIFIVLFALRHMGWHVSFGLWHIFLRSTGKRGPISFSFSLGCSEIEPISIEIGSPKTLIQDLTGTLISCWLWMS